MKINLYKKTLGLENKSWKMIFDMKKKTFWLLVELETS